jgi:hypothetical protein
VKTEVSSVVSWGEWIVGGQRGCKRQRVGPMKTNCLLLVWHRMFRKLTNNSKGKRSQGGSVAVFLEQSFDDEGEAKTTGTC